MLPGGIRPVERSLALAPVETGEVSAGSNRPDHAVGIDVETTRRESLNRRLRIVPRQFINFRQRGGRWFRAGVQAHTAAWKAEDRTPDGSIGRAHGNAIKRTRNPLVLLGIHRLIPLHIVGALAVSVGAAKQL